MNLHPHWLPPHKCSPQIYTSCCLNPPIWHGENTGPHPCCLVAPASMQKYIRKYTTTVFI
jgi:hypothetical protein